MSLQILDYSKKARMGTYIPLEHVTNEIIEDSKEFAHIKISCNECGYSENHIVCKCNIWGVLAYEFYWIEIIENHYGFNHGINPTENLILNYFKSKKQIKAKSTLIQRLIDDLGLKYFIHTFMDKKFRYSNDLAKIINKLVNDNIIQVKKEKNAWIYYIK